MRIQKTEEKFGGFIFFRLVGLKTVSVSLLSAWIRFAFMVASNFKEQGMNLIKVYLHT